MKQVLVWLPLLALPPALAVGYYLGVVHGQPQTVQPPRESEEPDDPNARAYAAFEQASRLLDQACQAKMAPNQELLRQAVVQYRVCLAYEPADAPTDGLFAEARRNLVVSQGLLEQAQRSLPTVKSAEPMPVPAIPAAAVPEPLAPAETKPAPAPERRGWAAASRPAGTGAERVFAKPLPGTASEEDAADRLISVGPDGVRFELVHPGKQSAGK